MSKKPTPAALALNVLHDLPEAKTVRAAALHYASKRNKFGPDHDLVRDAEENLYRQMLGFYHVAVAALQKLMETDDA